MVKINRYIIKILSIILLVFTFSCTVQYTPKKELNCEPVRPVCLPGSFDEVKIDTSSSRTYYYKIDKVKGMDSQENEWALSFYGDDKILFTYGNDNKQKLREYTFVNPTLLVSGSEINAVNGPFGIASMSGDNIYFSAEDGFLTSSVKKKYDDIASAKLDMTRVPLEYLPGQSRIFNGKLDNEKIVGIKNLSGSDELDIYDWEAHPALSPDGKVLFFSSTRNSEFNGTQIYFTKLDNNGNFGEIVELTNLNTPCDELSPFISKDGNRLYFSSNGHQTVGGYDLFYCDIDKEFWNSLDTKFISSPLNVGKPINTKFDELFPSSPENPKDLLYYSSNQDGNFDIFVLYENNRVRMDMGMGLKKEKPNFEIDVNENIEIKEPVPFKEVKKPVKVEVVKEKEEIKEKVEKKVKDYFRVLGNVKDKDNSPIPDADVKVRKQGEEKVSFETRTDKLGKYELSLEKGIGYEIRAQDGKHFYDTYYISKEEIEQNEVFEKKFVLDQSLDLRINFPYDVFDKPYDNIIDEAGHETNKNWIKEVDEVAKNIIERIDYIKTIKLTGHTDMQGSQTYNFTLGLNRAKFVYQELIKRGIPVKKLSYRSVGKLEPLAKREDESEEDYNRRLRRVNLEIINK